MLLLLLLLQQVLAGVAAQCRWCARLMHPSSSQH
jgi:hypothetical protein